MKKKIETKLAEMLSKLEREPGFTFHAVVSDVLFMEVLRLEGKTIRDCSHHIGGDYTTDTKAVFVETPLYHELRNLPAPKLIMLFGVSSRGLNFHLRNLKSRRMNPAVTYAFYENKKVEVGFGDPGNSKMLWLLPKRKNGHSLHSFVETLHTHIAILKSFIGCIESMNEAVSKFRDDMGWRENVYKQALPAIFIQLGTVSEDLFKNPPKPPRAQR